MSSSDREFVRTGETDPWGLKERATGGLIPNGPEKLPMFPQIAEDERLGRTYAGLREAVEKLYRAAYWTPDRTCDAEGLWEQVRDRAGLTPGKSPRPLFADREGIARWVVSQLAGIEKDDAVIANRDELANGDVVLTIRWLKAKNVYSFLTDVYKQGINGT